MLERDTDAALRRATPLTHSKYFEFITQITPVLLSEQERLQSLLQKIVILNGGALALALPLYKEIIRPAVSANAHLARLGSLMALSWVFFGVSILMTIWELQRADRGSNVILIEMQKDSYRALVRSAATELENQINMEMNNECAATDEARRLAAIEELQSHLSFAKHVIAKIDQLGSASSSAKSRHIRTGASICLMLTCTGIALMLSAAVAAIL